MKTPARSRRFHYEQQCLVLGSRLVHVRSRFSAHLFGLGCRSRLVGRCLDLGLDQLFVGLDHLLVGFQVGFGHLFLGLGIGLGAVFRIGVGDVLGHVGLLFNRVGVRLGLLLVGLGHSL